MKLLPLVAGLLVIGALCWAATEAAAIPPAPANDPPVLFEPCPVDHAWAGCYSRGVVYVNRAVNDSPIIVQHELGHAYDQHNLDQGERNRIMRVLRWPIWRVEAFADFYAGCRVRLRPARDFAVPRFYRRERDPARVARICRLITRAGLR